MTTIHSLDCICKLSSHNLKSVLYTLQHFLEIHVVYAFEETVTVLLTVTSGFHDACQSAQILLLRVRLFRWWQQCNLATWVRKKTDPSFCTCDFWRNEQLLVRNDWRKLRRKGILARASLVRWLLGTWIHVLSKTTLDCAGCLADLITRPVLPHSSFFINILSKGIKNCPTLFKSRNKSSHTYYFHM